MLPKNLKYGSKVESALSRSSRVNIAPQNGTGNYVKGDTIIINIPTRNNLVLASTESYLKFDVQFTSGAAANAFRWDSCGAHGLIQRIRVFHGSNLCSDIDNYGLLAKMLFDLQQPADCTYGKQSQLCGTRTDTVLKMPTLPALADNVVATINAGLTTPLSGANISVQQINSGERFLTAAGTGALIANAGNSSKNTYCLNLISLIGSLSSQNYVPLFAMTSAPLRVEIQLVDSTNKCIASLTGADNNTFTISNCEYVANFIELGDPAMSIIYQNLGGGPLEYVFPDFRNYGYTATLIDGVGVTTQVNMPIPAKFSSLKSIIVAVRDKGLGTATFFPFSSVQAGILDYQFRIGSQILPAQPPSTKTEMFAELIKAYGSIADVNYQPAIDKLSYNLVTSSAYADDVDITANLAQNKTSNVQSGSFYIGLDLENYASAPKETIFAGMNTNTDDIFLVGNFALNTGAGNINARFDAFANFDCVLVCENNIAYVKF